MRKKPTAGGYVDSYCTKCRLNLDHTVIAMIGDRVARVKCGTCGSEHNYKDATKEKAKESRPKPASAKTSGKSGVQKRWDVAMTAAQGEDISYDMNRRFTVGDVVSHKTFGRGAVLETAQKKIRVIFQDQERMLVSGN